MDFFTWLNSLHPRLQHIIQIRFKKSFTYYDLALAADAVQNSQAMHYNQRVGHFFPGRSPCLAEVAAYTPLNNNDESALQSLVDFWYNSRPHKQAIQSHHVLGIGFYYDKPADTLWATIRLM